ncbi:MAG: ferredoxin [Patescibacteria group bacterium]
MNDKEKKYHVRVLSDTCIGAGPCTVIASKVFELTEEGKAVILKKDGTKTSDSTSYAELSEEDASIILEAAKSCPVFAVVIEDGEGRQIWPEVRP